MKKLLIFVITFIIFTINVNADSINNISMDIYLDQYGNAHITETWDITVNSGTEGYKPYYNIDNAKIKDFEVTNQEGQKFIFQNDWNVQGSFSDKSYKNGFNYLDNGVELCWGISNYGKNVYTLKYIIEGFVSKTTDKQMIYWGLVPYDLSLSPKEVNIVIHTDQKFNDDIAVWGYGNYGGTAYVYDGEIKMNSAGALKTKEYMTILVELPEDMFQTSNSVDDDFNYYFNMAEEGATHFIEEESNVNSFLSVISSFISLIFFLVSFVIIYIVFSKKDEDFIKVISKGHISKDIEYFREIPTNKNIFYANFLVKNYKLHNNNNHTILGSLILIWIKKGYIEIKTLEEGKLKKKTRANLIMNINKFTKEVDNDSLESKMFNYMYKASKDGILEEKEFENYCKDNYTKIMGWFDKIISTEKDKAIKDNLIVKVSPSSKKYNETQEIYDEAKKLAGLKKFLLELSSIEDKSAIEVHLWDYYLIYAQLFGVADKVAEEFKKLYPDVLTDLNYDNVVIIRSFSYGGFNAASSAQSLAESQARGYSSGGGGFSSGGGGGGSFGGGGGGGFR